MINEQLCRNCGAARAVGARYCQTCGAAFGNNPPFSDATFLSIPQSIGEQPTATDVGGGLSRIGKAGVAFLLVPLFIIIWLATGIYQIGPGEQAARRLFGVVQEVPIEQEGLHWWCPRPVGQKDVVLITEVRSMELGFISTETGSIAPRYEEALMISGDLNIVDVQMVVQYNIKDLNAFLFNVDDPGEATRAIAQGRPEGRTLKEAAEAALRLVVGQHTIDDVITKQRSVIETDTGLRLQDILDSYQTGINVVGVQLQDVKTPEEVRDAYDDVLRARQDRATMINLAYDYENSLIYQAKVEAEKIINAAETSGPVRTIQAEEEASRFASILLEYDKKKDTARRRLYLESMEEMLPGVTKFIVSVEPHP